MASSPRPRRTAVRVLDEDRTLAAVLSADDLAAARNYAVADVVDLPRGRYHPSEQFDGAGLLGLLVLRGLMMRRVAVADRHCGELVGPGAVLRPWDDFGRNAPLPFDVSWRVIRNMRIALLDRRFMATIIRWPALMEAFTERTNERSQTLAFVLAIHCLQHTELRLLVLLWHLADRFGTVAADGIHVPLPLSHADLAELVGVARPSVSLSLKELAAKRLVWRNPNDKTWVLSGEPPSELRDMRRHRSAR